MAEPLKGKKYAMWEKVKRIIVVLGQLLLKLVAIALFAIALWKLFKWLPDNLKPVVGTILGWILGLLSSPIVERLKNAVEYQSLTRLLLVEVRANNLVASGYSNLGLRDPQPHPVRPILPGYFRTTAFTATLGRQGLLPIEIISELHWFYSHISNADRFHVASESDKYSDKVADGLMTAAINEARKAAQ